MKTTITNHLKSLYENNSDRINLFTFDELQNKIIPLNNNQIAITKLLTTDYNKIHVIPEIIINTNESTNAKIESPQFIVEKYFDQYYTSVILNIKSELTESVANIIYKVLQNVPIHLIIKSEIKDELQLFEEKAIGVSTHFINLSSLKVPILQRYADICSKLNISLIVNCISIKEIEIAINSGIKAISISSTDMTSKKENILNTMNLRKHIPNKIVTFCEYGIRTLHNLKQLNEVGFDAAIVSVKIADHLDVSIY